MRTLSIICACVCVCVCLHMSSTRCRVCLHMCVYFSTELWRLSTEVLNPCELCYSCQFLRSPLTHRALRQPGHAESSSSSAIPKTALRSFGTVKKKKKSDIMRAERVWPLASRWTSSRRLPYPKPTFSGPFMSADLNQFFPLKFSPSPLSRGEPFCSGNNSLRGLRFINQVSNYRGLKRL